MWPIVVISLFCEVLSPKEFAPVVPFKTVKRSFFMFSVLKASNTTFLCKLVFGETYLKKSAFIIH